MTKRVALGLAALSLSIFAVVTLLLWIQPNAAPEVIASSDAPKGSNHPDDTSSPAIDSPSEATPKVSAENSRNRVAVDRTALREQNNFNVANSVINRYGKVIAGLKLSAVEEQKAMNLLIDRAKVVYYVGEALTQEEKDNYPLFQQIITSAQAEIDWEIREAFDPDTAAKLEKLITARAYLPTINEWFDPAMAAAGVPMEPEQVFPLLSVLHDTYGGNSDLNMRYVVANIDRSTGLTELDQLALDRAKSILSLRQLSEFKESIVKRNKVILQRIGGES